MTLTKQDQIRALKNILSQIKGAKIIQTDPPKDEIVGYVSICDRCQHTNITQIPYGVLKETKELICQKCRTTYKINPIPAVVDISEIEIDNFINEMNK